MTFALRFEPSQAVILGFIMAPSKCIINEPIPIRGGRNDKSKPPMIEITQSMSQPADPDAPSFLTNLPAEIRNTVYRILFTRDQPIEITDREEQRNYPVWLEYIDITEDEELEERIEEEAAIYTKWRGHDFDQGINLLRTCRQIYWEAIGTLYSANSFCVTSPQHRHNWTLLQIKTVADFIESIGTHISLITKLSIDIDRLCPYTCADQADVDLLPLVRILWSRPSIAPQISFTTGLCPIDPNLHGWSNDVSNQSISVARMNRILHMLSVADHLDLRRYGRFERLVREIRVCVYTDTEARARNWVSHGFFSSRDRQYDAREFDIDEVDGTLTWSSTPVRLLNDLPIEAYFRVVKNAYSVSRNINFHLQKHTGTGFQPNVFQLDRRSRETAQCLLQTLSKTTLRLETCEAVTSFQDFGVLREWCEGSYGQLLKQHRGSSSKKVDNWPAPRILLHFNSPGMTLAGLRINIKSLICLTYYMNKDVTVRFVLCSTKAGKSEEEIYEIGLQTIHRRCFILLSIMLLEKPRCAYLSAPEI